MGTLRWVSLHVRGGVVAGPDVHQQNIGGGVDDPVGESKQERDQLQIGRNCEEEEKNYLILLIRIANSSWPPVSIIF